MNGVPPVGDVTVVGKAGKEERIGHSVRTALATRAARRVVRDHAIAVRGAGCGQLVDEGGRERACETDDGRTVGPGIELIEPGRASNIVEGVRNVGAAKGEGVLVRYPVVNPARVLSLILPGRERCDMVQRPLEKTWRRRRIYAEQGPALRAEPIPGNDVAWKRLPRRRIGDDPDAAEERICRVQQLAEIPSPHRHGRNGKRLGRFLTPAELLFTPEEEQLVTAAVELARNEDRST